MTLSMDIALNIYVDGVEVATYNQERDTYTVSRTIPHPSTRKVHAILAEDGYAPAVLDDIAATHRTYVRRNPLPIACRF